MHRSHALIKLPDRHYLFEVFRGSPQLDERIAAQALMLHQSEEGVPCPAGADELHKPLRRAPLSQRKIGGIPSRNDAKLTAEERDKLLQRAADLAGGIEKYVPM